LEVDITEVLEDGRIVLVDGVGNIEKVWDPLTTEVPAVAVAASATDVG
jgi:hypothetical protein